jgi:hypothetical protein
MQQLPSLRRLLPATIALFAGSPSWCQNFPNSGMQYIQNILVPGWLSTGSRGNANVDVMGFNPVTRLMYLADRTNHAIDVIDTQSNVVVGRIAMASNSVPNVPVVAIDLQQLAVSDGLKSVYVWDLKAPQPQPDKYDMPSTGVDALDYDPINQTIYAVTDDSPYYLVGISLRFKKIMTQTVLPASADLIKFNPVDGKMYVAAEDADNNNAGAGIIVYDPATDKITAQYKIGPACPGHGIDIDPISNVAVMGCFGGMSNGDVAVDLKTGTLLKTFTDVGGTDTVVFNPNNRRFYAGAGLNTATTSGCPKTAPGPFGALTPVVGVFDAMGPATAPAQFDGVACSGGGNHIAGVDPIRNFVYVPVGQYPPDPASGTTGVNGVLVFHDSTAPAQPPIAQAQATLFPVGSSSAQGLVQFSLEGRRMRLSSNPTGIFSGNSAWIVVPTTVGNEIVTCVVVPANFGAVCGENLIGDPLVGATVTLSVEGMAVARGTIGTLPASQ